MNHEDPLPLAYLTGFLKNLLYYNPILSEKNQLCDSHTDVKSQTFF